MGKLVVTEFVSLNGVMQAPGGEDFKYPGSNIESIAGKTETTSSFRRRWTTGYPDRTRHLRELRRRVAIA